MFVFFNLLSDGSRITSLAHKLWILSNQLFRSTSVSNLFAVVGSCPNFKCQSVTAYRHQQSLRTCTISYPSFLMILISLRSTLSSLSGSITCNTASTAIGARRPEYWDTTCTTRGEKMTP